MLAETERIPFAWMFEEDTAVDEESRALERDARQLAEAVVCCGCGQTKEPTRRNERLCLICQAEGEYEENTSDY